MKLAYLSTYDKQELGGGEEHLLLLVREGMRRGVNIAVIVPAGSALEAAAGETGATVISLDLRPPNFLRAIKEIRLTCELYRFQVLHTHGFYANQIGRLAARRAKIPIIVSTAHCLPDAQLAGLQSFSITRMRSLLNQFLRDHLDNYTSNMATRIIAISDAIRNSLIQQGISSKKIVVIRNGIDISLTSNNGPITREAARDILGLDRSDQIIGTVARLEKVKSIDTLILALRNEELLGVTLVIVGGGSQKEALKTLAKRMGVFERIRFIDHMKDFHTAILAFDVFVMTSLSEGLGLLLIWAQALGTPAIATRAGGITEIIDDEVNGYLFKPADDKELSNKLAVLLKNEDLRDRLAREGRRVFEDKFTSQIMLEKTFDLYEKLLADHQKRL